MKKVIGLYFSILLTSFSFGQSAYAPLNKDYYHLLDRYEILNGKATTAFFTSVKPFERRDIAAFLDSLSIDSLRLSKADRFNIEYLRNDNWEWTNARTNESRKPILKHFYRKKSDLYSVHNEDFDLHVNPVVCFQLGKEGNNANTRFINSRGIEVRGMIDRKVGFYAFLTDNQASFPTYTERFINDYGAVPNEGYWKNFKNNKGVDFLTGRGYITFNITKHIHFQFGHDKNFIGNGYRSLILSDFSSNYTFLKLNTKVWKFNYTNLFAEMTAQRRKADQKYPQKYMAFHHLSLNIGKSLNVGVFESIMFGSKDSTKLGQFEINYLNPIIFYRSIEQHTGSSDNAFLGLDYKWNFLNHFSFYGQIVLDEFFLSHIRAHDGWWANKQAAQAGLKYINAFGVKNLDLQGEFNVVRPYTYAHASYFTNYTNYNQPLAHPWGANFYEWIGIARYQPLPRLALTGKLFFTKYGADSSVTAIGLGNNYGGDPHKSYNLISQANTFGNRIGQGIDTKILYLSFTATYQIRHNLFLDLTQIVRRQDSAWNVQDLNTSFTALAIRWNIPQRLQEF